MSSFYNLNFHSRRPGKPFHNSRSKRRQYTDATVKNMVVFSPMGPIKKLIFSFLWALNSRFKPFIFFMWLKMARISDFLSEFFIDFEKFVEKFKP
jgi:hypothetical protein